MTTKTFAAHIAAMNAMYKLPAHGIPTLPADPADRLSKFKKTLLDEVHEIDELIAMASNRPAGTDETALMTGIADLLGDIIVYCRSEALKYGLPLEDVLDIIMDSNESKLDADGKPIYDENGKFLKGPNYWKPEPKIAKRLMAGCGVQQGDWK